MWCDAAVGSHCDLHPGTLTGVDQELGTLEPRKRADLVLVRGKLDDVEDLKERVADVWKHGHEVI